MTNHSYADEISGSYGGDINSREAWQLCQDDPDAVLVDVRTRAEWSFVGLPDLTELGRRPLCIEWQRYPDMAVNSNFAGELRARGVDPATTVLLLCRSGQRSRHAAIALTADGYKRCINVADGFEGLLDGAGHRGVASGWKAAGLPWLQA